MTLFEQIVLVAGGLMTVSNFIILFFRPIRDKVFGLGRAREGQRCMLRSEMLKIYYAHKETKVVPQYKLENFYKMYEAYKALGGNSFIDDVKEEIHGWSVSQN